MYSIGLLGATGTVGQKALALLSKHTQFSIKEITASSEKINKSYLAATTWREELPFPQGIASLHIKSLDTLESPYLISALPHAIANDVEPYLAKKGHIIFSNASAHRMKYDVPLLIPEVNPDHLSFIKRQTTKGKIITNPNCVVAIAAPALAPLTKFSIEHISLITLQAISGAGYLGISPLEIFGNLIPYIPEEEEKICREIKKIFTPLNFSTTVHVHRVPIIHGHTVAMHIHFKDPVSPQDAKEIYRGLSHILIHEEEAFPQPAKSLTPDDMRIHIGRIKQGGTSRILGLVALGHNLVRGAAGAAIANLKYYLENQ